MKRLAFSCFAALLCAAPLAAGCGSLGDVDHREPLAVLQGQLTQTSAAATAAPSNVRIAVVWMNVVGDGYRVTQDVQATPVFPSSFRLELTDPPPQEAMMTRDSKKAEPPETSPSTPATPGSPPSGGTTPTPDTDRVGTRSETDKWPASFSLAYGAVVAYEDKNGNGKLDLVDDGASSYIDRILGANEDLALLYIEGTTPADAKDKNGKMPSAGYNIYRGLGRSCELEADATNGTPRTQSESTAKPCSTPEWLGMNTLYDLPLTADPKFAKIMCRSGNASGTGSETTIARTPTPGPGPNGVYPKVGDPNLHCASDGKTYYYSECKTYSEGLCKGDIMTCSSTSWSMPTATTPDGWPCTVP